MLPLFFALSLAASERAIAVLDVAAVTPADAALAGNMTPLLVQAVAEATRAKVVGINEIKAMIDTQATQSLMGCTDDRCVADLSKTLAVDEVVIARIGVVGKLVLVSASVIAVREARVTARVSQTQASGGALPELARRAALGLLDPEALRAGDEPLSTLRLAVLVDEFDADGKALQLRSVEACIAGELDKIGAQLVATEQVQTLRTTFSPRDLVGGAIPAALTSNDVDAVLVGVVGYADNGKIANAIGVRADLTLRLVRVDSAQILASRQLEAAGVGFQPVSALKDAGKKLCAAAAPSLKEALAQKSARGARVTFEVDKLKSAADATRLQAQLAALPRVTQVQVRRATASSATLDVTMSAADGVGLALLLDASASSGVVVKDAEVTRVRAELR